MNQLIQNKVLVGLAVALVAYGLLKPDLSNILTPSNKPVINNPSVQIDKPTDSALLEACDKVIESLRSGGSSRRADGPRLSSLYSDLANLLALDGDKQVVKTTVEVRDANRIAGWMTQLDIDDKYENLSEAANGVVVAGLGDDEAVLDETLRARAVETFRALSWACNEGAK